MSKISFAIVLSTTIVFAACNNSNISENEKDTEVLSSSDTTKITGAVKYTCEMHPEIISDTPGHCPKCEMNLIPIKDSTKK